MTATDSNQSIATAEHSVTFPTHFTWFAVVATLVFVSPTRASEAITVEPDGTSYHFVSHYAVAIDAPANVVWKHLRELGSWMYEFELLPVSGTPGEEGEVRRLYSGQDFFIEITKVIPDRLFVFANLPSEFNGEHSTGVAVITLNEVDEITTVNLTMSRRYSWGSKEPNPHKSMRESAELRKRTRAKWHDRFLGRLRKLVEEGP